MDSRFSEHFPPEAEPAPEAKPVDLGPSANHRLHGRIPISADCELRITSQPCRRVEGRTEAARLQVRKWFLRRDSKTWWPSKQDSGAFVLARDKRAFLAAVTAAVEALEQDGDS